MTFGIVSEGPTDQVVIEHILAAYFEDRELFVTRLQPSEGKDGNWHKVFRYCESSDFKAAFTLLDYVIIHLDTDFMSAKNVGKKYKIDTDGLEVDELVQAFRNKLRELIDLNFYERFKNQILFAIAVNEIECWLMPICFEGDKMATKTKGCTKAITKFLRQQKEYDFKLKKEGHYRELMSSVKDKTTLINYSDKNPSFQLFVEELSSKLSASES